MSEKEQGVLDKPVSLTPKSIFTMAAGLVIAYGWIFATFVTQADLSVTNQHVQQVSNDLAYHIEEAAIWQVQTQLTDTMDKLDDLERLMASDNSISNQKRKAELERRRDDYEGKIVCLRKGEKHCLSGHQ